MYTYAARSIFGDFCTLIIDAETVSFSVGQVSCWWLPNETKCRQSWDEECRISWIHTKFWKGFSLTCINSRVRLQSFEFLIGLVVCPDCWEYPSYIRSYHQHWPSTAKFSRCVGWYRPLSLLRDGGKLQTILVVTCGLFFWNISSTRTFQASVPKAYFLSVCGSVSVGRVLIFSCISYITLICLNVTAPKIGCWLFSKLKKYSDPRFRELSTKKLSKSNCSKIEQGTEKFGCYLRFLLCQSCASLPANAVGRRLDRCSELKR